MFVKYRQVCRILSRIICLPFAVQIYKRLKFSVLSFCLLFCMGVGCKTLHEVHRISVFQNRVVRRIFQPTKAKVTDDSINSIVRRFVICTPHGIGFGRWERGGGRRTMKWTGYVARMGERWNADRVLVGKSEVMTPLGRHRIDRLILKCILKKLGGRACTGLIWFRVGTSGRLLWMW